MDHPGCANEGERGAPSSTRSPRDGGPRGCRCSVAAAHSCFRAWAEGRSGARRCRSDSRAWGSRRFPSALWSSFRGWAADKTNHPREVAEAALAHLVRNPIEAAYRRTAPSERRRRLMDDFAEYLAGRRAGTETRPDPATAQRPLPGSPGAFRGNYGPWNRPGSAIAVPRGLRVGWTRSRGR